MAFDPITAVSNIVSTVVDRLLPDKAQAEAAKAALLEMQLKGELDNAIEQLKTDQAEAANQSLLVAGWRPFVGWACGFAFVYAFILQPFAQTICVIAHRSFDPKMLPVLNLDAMMPVLLGMLGLGAMRTIDKYNGTGNGH